MVTMALSASFACGNLVAPPLCNADGSSPQPGKYCTPREDLDGGNGGGSGGGSGGGTGGGSGDGGIGGDQ